MMMGLRAKAIQRSPGGGGGGIAAQKPLDMHQLAARGDEEFKAGRFEDARTFYLQAIEAGPKEFVSILTWEKLGDCELQLGGSREKAHEYYRESIRRLPNEPWARDHQASILDKMGNPEGARMLREEADDIRSGKIDKY